MERVPQISPGNRGQSEALWRRQWLVASRSQLVRRGWSTSAIDRAVQSRRLYRVHRGIYSPIEPDLLDDEGRHAAAVLLGVPGWLCGTTAAWWLRLTKRKPPLIHVAVPGPRADATGIRWHELRLRDDEVGKFRRMPCTSPPRTALDCAVSMTLKDRQLLLAELEFRFDIEAADLEPILRCGHPGSAHLREAIESHLPLLASTRSELEQAFVHLLNDNGLKLPLINHPSGTSTVDAIYQEEGIAIELDGVRGHRGDRRILRDHRRDLRRRREGRVALRYHYSQLIDDENLVVEDLLRAGVPYAVSSAAISAKQAT